MYEASMEGQDEISEATMLYNEDKLVHWLREAEPRGQGDVQSHIRFFEEGQLFPQTKVKVRSELVITADERSSGTFLREPDTWSK